MNADNMVGRTVAGYLTAQYIGEGGPRPCISENTRRRARQR
jgi:hypothetical protein